MVCELDQEASYQHPFAVTPGRSQIGKPVQGLAFHQSTIMNYLMLKHDADELELLQLHQNFCGLRNPLGSSEQRRSHLQGPGRKRRVHANLSESNDSETKQEAKL